MWAKRCAYEQKKLSRDKKGLSKSFKKIEKRDERCAQGQKKLSTGDKALAVSKSFSGIGKYMLCSRMATLIIILLWNIVSWSFARWWYVWERLPFQF